jgi:hypothetical protein
MKILPKLRLTTLLLLIIFLLPSCGAYQSRSVSSEDAVLVSQKVKIKTSTNQFYKFENLQKEDGLLIGIAKRRSKTANDLIDKIITKDSNSKFVKILLPENFISEIHLKSKTRSVIATIFGIAGLSVVVGIGFLFLIFS